jgi:ATP-dependent Clp protease adapter protein ClpS
VNAEAADPAKKRFVVFIYEIRREVVFAEEFGAQYLKTVTLSDGTERTVELTPMIRDGNPVIEFKDTGHCTYIGTQCVRTGSHTNGNLMVQVIDLEDRPATPQLMRDKALTSFADFVPAGFTHGIEILNDEQTPMEFVVQVLSAEAGLSKEDAMRTMLAIHMRGGALIPLPSSAEAERIAAQIRAQATRHSYPLLCRAVG